MTQGKDIAPGDEATRTEIQAVWGGALQGGILPAKRSDSVLIFSDPSRGEQYGYYDGWLPDDGDGPVFEYTGQGQTGHQEMLRGNKAIREHRADGTTLRVFVASRERRQGPQVFKYLGEFELDEAEPVYERLVHDATDRDRIVFMFRLRPKTGAIVDAASALPPANRTAVTQWAPIGEIGRYRGKHARPSGSRRIAPERNLNTQTTRSPSEAVTVKRLEAELCRRFEAFLADRNHDVCRFEIRVKGEPGIMRTDTCDETDLVLYEAKGDASRGHVRQAIGQLLDYVRHLHPKRKRCAVLLPSKPTPDVEDLLKSQNIALVYEENGEFVGWPVSAL
ncbi:hypothetical protein [Glycomyces dulcitolivorans]|uniref:hypothetical protein n=1 Tax=Glycomyces dulcitolivorans TaxID=2200759 RepID=UPI000DD3EF9C|nr:hypothetical protein [Glycomyces dulcitolivorans]